MKLYEIFTLSIIICLISCLPATKEDNTILSLDTKDTTFRLLKGYQDRQEIDSLLQYTSSNDPNHRYVVATAFASIQSEKGLDSLFKLLNDPLIKVRTAAAYSIGQIGDASATNELLNAFKTKDTLNVNNTFNAAILEAIGKIGNKKLLPSLATVSTYRPTDTLLIIGQSRALYNYALRGIVASEGTDKMVQNLTSPDISELPKLIAANYLARTKSLDLSSYKFQLGQVFTTSTSPDIRMALAIALGKTKDKEVHNILKDQYKIEKDPRVKTNIMRAMSNFNYIEVIDNMLAKLGDKDLNISNTAAQYILNNGLRTDATIYKSFINDSLHFNTQATMYQAILKHIPAYYTNTRNILKNDIYKKIENTSNEFVKAAYYSAFKFDPVSYKEIIEKTSESKSNIIRTTGAEVISGMLKSPNFGQTFGTNQRYIKRDILKLIKSEINKGDAGVSAVYGELLSNKTLDLKQYIQNPMYLDTAINKLNLPAEIETYNNLSKALAYLTDKKHVAKQPAINHPINWSVLNAYGDSVLVAIKTDKGVIRLRMYTQEAPGTVTNFLALAKDNFYDGKLFHRVVPNFVVQGGCPRGDGYGALDYTIRSEVPQLYFDTEGVIGMASAGLHTEGTQWFITHSPSMHLSGKYTIFGKVVKGMEVVHKIEIGDKINSIIITKG
ncbi:MAG: peptidylprolyl isomerase [Saprospiraceae bacterium]